MYLLSKLSHYHIFHISYDEYGQLLKQVIRESNLSNLNTKQQLDKYFFEEVNKFVGNIKKEKRQDVVQDDIKKFEKLATSLGVDTDLDS